MDEGNRETILVVDDDPDFAAGLTQLLDTEGYRSIAATSGSDAMFQIGTYPLDAALIDVHLPDMDGIELAEFIRARLGPDVPILMMSGDDSTELIERLFRRDSTCFLKKPIRPNLLLYQIEKSLAKAGESPHAESEN